MAKWTRKVEVEGKEREKILDRAAKVIRTWGLTMPEVFPAFVLDFGLRNFAVIGHTEYWIANEEEEEYCGKFIFMFDGQSCPAHQHLKKHETFFVVKGTVVMHLPTGDLPMKPGHVLPMDRKTVHGFTAQGDSLILEVSLPSMPKDNIFREKRIGTKGVV